MEHPQIEKKGKSQRLLLRRQVGWGRTAMLVIILVSLLNQILLLCKVNYHFLFSAAVPYYLNWLGQELELGAFKVLAVVLSIILYAAYIGCWLLSERRREWFLAALGLYGLDTLLLIIFAFTLLENPMSCFFEVIVHFAALGLIYLGMRAAEKLSRMPKRRRSPVQQPDQPSVQ